MGDPGRKRSHGRQAIRVSELLDRLDPLDGLSQEPFAGLGQIIAHRIDRRRELSQLVMATDLQRLLEIATGHPPDLGNDGIEWAPNDQDAEGRDHADSQHDGDRCEREGSVADRAGDCIHRGN